MTQWKWNTILKVIIYLLTIWHNKGIAALDWSTLLYEISSDKPNWEEIVQKNSLKKLTFYKLDFP